MYTKMNMKLSQAVEAIEKLPLDRQDRLADALLKAATLELADEKIAAGEASYTAHGGQPAREVFERLISKYDDL